MSSTARFKVDPRLATLLGESYRSTEKALKELVDNAWDADAANVCIIIPADFTTDPIVISDDGSGMTEREVRIDYLSVAKDRRTRKGEKTTRKRRAVKGRKGIGKFAGLMAGDVMHLETRALGKLTRLTIRKDDLLRADADLEQIDLPVEVSACEEKEHGTTITITHLNQKYSLPSVDYFKRILIMEYGRSEDFRIEVNGTVLGIADLPGPEFEETTSLDGVGHVRLRFKVSDAKQNLAQSGIALRVGGKIVGGPIFFGVDDDEEIPVKLLKKVYGELEADGLSDDVTADWGAVIENSRAFQILRPWVHDQLRAGISTVYKKEIEQQRARLDRRIKERLSHLPEYRREFAEAALQRVMFRFYGESADRINVIASVVLDALEQDEYYAVLAKIEEARESDVQALAEALEEFGLVDFVMIAQQAQNRLRFLDDLENLVLNPETLEKQVHTAIEKNLWILGSQYALMASNKTTARVIKEYTDKEFTGNRANNRPDLLLANNLDEDYLLIEFKRPSHTLSYDDEAQVKKYRADLTPRFGRLKIILMGGKPASGINGYYDQVDVRFLSYVGVISNARRQLNWLLKEVQMT